MRSVASGVVGVGYTDISPNSGRSTLQLATEAAQAALADAGMTAADVDGLVTYHLDDSDPALGLAQSLGLDDPGVMVDWSDGGGNLACGVVGLADAAIRAGMAHTVIVYRSLNGRSGRRLGGMGQGVDTTGVRQFMTPAGWTTYPEMIAMWARRHMEVYGTTPEHLGTIAVKSRAHAKDNPRAQKREPITLDDYFASPLICDPFRLYDICLESDGACAVVVTAMDRARDTAKPPVGVLAAAHGGTGSGPGADLADVLGMGDLARNFGYAVRDRLYGMAGVTAADLDFAEIYDCFTASVILQLEGFGIVGPGEAGPYVAGDDTFSLGSKLPINTHGGLLSEGYLHGLNHVTEAVLQLRGECGPRQVPDAELALVTAGAMATGSALVLGRV
ncbi:MAG: acetyl-CoA acetyltransferase [Propionibacteriales bacterium]|nr:acetyl-CoA acetyltransferase [Propionibacteriales bacterium]